MICGLVGAGGGGVRVGGAAEGGVTNLLVRVLFFVRAVHEFDVVFLFKKKQKNRRWQPKHCPLLHAVAFVVALEYAADTEAIVLGKPSTAYFEAALQALDADAGLTWMVGDDIESDIAGAQKHGMRTILVRTGKFRPDAV